MLNTNRSSNKSLQTTITTQFFLFCNLLSETAIIQLHEENKDGGQPNFRYI